MQIIPAHGRSVPSLQVEAIPEPTLLTAIHTTSGLRAQVQSLWPRMQACAESVARLESTLARLPPTAKAEEHGQALRGQMLLQLQRFHEFEYQADWPRHADVPQRPHPLGPSSAAAADASLRGSAETLAAVDDALVGTGDFFDDLRGLIDLIGADYLNVYNAVVTRYARMFEAFSERFTAIIAAHIKGVDDGKNVEVGIALVEAMRALVVEYSRVPGPGILYPVDYESHHGSYADSLKWAAALGLPASSVKNWPPYLVMMDVSPLVTIRDSLPITYPSAKWDSARFQAWQTGFSAQESEMKNKLQMLTSKYSNAHAYHDNFNKILSTQLSQFTDMLKAYLNF